MKAKAIIAVVIVLVAVAILTGVRPVAEAETVEGATNVKGVLIVRDQSGHIVGVYPSELYIEHVYTATYNANESGSISYTVRDKSWWWQYPPGGPQTRVYVPELGAWLQLKYNVDFSVDSGNKQVTSGNETYTYSGVAVGLSVKTYIYFETPPNVTGVINIGYYILKYVFGGVDPVISYSVTVTKYVDGQPTADETYTGSVMLDYRNIQLNIYTVELYLKDISRTGYIERGDLSTTATLQPLYNVTVCGNVVGADTTFSMLMDYAGKEAVLKVDGDAEPECATLNNVSLPVGANQTIVLTVKSGVFTLLLNYTANVEGALISVGKVTGAATGSPGKWNFTFVAPVYVSGYFSRWPTLSVACTVSGSVIGSVSCEMSISSPGSYKLLCSTLSSFSGSSPDILKQTYTAKVTITDEFGVEHTFTGSVSMNAFDPTNIADIAWQAYSAAQSVIAGGVIFAVVLIIISIVKESVSGTPLVDVYYVRGTLLTLVVAFTVLSVGIPILYKLYLDMLANIPLFQSYVTSLPSGDPKTVFTGLVGYYDTLFEAIESDYYTMYVANVNNILGAMRNIVTIFVGIMLTIVALAVVSMWFGGQFSLAPIASLGNVLMSIVFTYLSLLITIAPLGAIVIVSVAVGRLVILIVTVIATAVLTAGVILLSIPSALSQRLGEDMFSAGILYFITVPFMGPISYTLYKYVLDVSLRGIEDSFGISLGIVSFFIPIKPLVEIMIYFIASGAVTMMIIISVAYVLVRSGVAVGLGEAFSSIVWRG